jgi:hypothetical protein
MKLSLLFFTLAGLGLAQDQSRLRIVLTNPDGTTVEARITGKPAAQGFDILRQWMLTQTVCTTASPVDGVAQEPVCAPKFANGAEYVKELVLGSVESIAKQGNFVSAELAAEAADIRARVAALEAKKKAAFDAARAEK